jgi:hypothetical protein
MNPMSAEKVASFISFLDDEMQSRWNERTLLNNNGKSEQAYYCKMRAAQTDMIKTVFVNMLNDKSPTTSLREDIERLFGNNCEIHEP